MFGLPASLGLPFKPAAAPATSYVNSVQYVTITIPTGATSATATISAVGSLAFLNNLGFETITASNGAIGYPRVELTNTTTVTAYRNTSDASITVTVKACVVDATSDLVTSVQRGTITVASGSTSNTATISAVTNANTIVTHQGQTTDETSQVIKQIENVLSLSGTTVTATRQDGTSGSITVGYQVVEFKGSALAQSVQNIAKTWNSGTSTTATITSVNTNNAIIFYAGSSCATTANHAQAEQMAQLTDATTVTISINTASTLAHSFNCSVVEFASGVLASAVQRGTTTLTAATSNTSTITAVNTSKAMLNYLHYTASTSTSSIRDTCSSAYLTNSTTVTVARGTANNNITGSWAIAEFN